MASSLLLPFSLLVFLSLLSLSSSQSPPPPRNVQVFFPSTAIPVSPSLPSPPPPPSFSPDTTPPSSTSGGGGGGGGGSSSRSVTKAVVGTAFGSFALSALLFFFLHRYTTARHRPVKPTENPYAASSPPLDDSKVSIVDENGLDMIYLRKMPAAGGVGGVVTCSYCKGRVDLDDRVELVKDGGSGGVGGERRKVNRKMEEMRLLPKDSISSSDSAEYDLFDPGKVFPSSARPSHPPLPPTSTSTQWVSSVPHSAHPVQQLASYVPQSGYPVQQSATSAPLSAYSVPPSASSVRQQSPSSFPQLAPSVQQSAVSPPLPLPPSRQSASPPPPPATVVAGAGAPPPPPPAGPPTSSAPAPPPPQSTMAIGNKGPARPASAPPPPPPPRPPTGAPAPPPPPPPGKGSAPSPPPPPGKGPSPPPPPPPKKGTAPPPPPPGKAPPPPPGGSKPPPPPPGKSGEVDTTGGPTKRAPLPVPARFKPLHWEKMTTANTEHSMVWDKIHDGSFRVDDDLMEALFGTVATNRKAADSKPAAASAAAGPPQIVLLDPRKSQNIAIVLRSLAISRKDILDALLEGHGLAVDTLEKLSKVAPTKDEESLILEFGGDPTRLADAESFLFHLLRAVPAPFARLDAMLLKATYPNEAAVARDSLAVIEAACKEMRNRGLFVKLLEAVLKAGNRMNAGTTRGNAKAFNLSSLRKLSDVKSTDGKTTLLHFIVQEVVRSEGKRAVLNRDHGFGRSSSTRSSAGGEGGGDPSAVEASKAEREREYMMLGLPAVGGLSAELANVKKAAVIDFDAMVGSWVAVEAKVREARRFVSTCNDVGGFVKEMRAFLEATEEEMKALVAERERVMELVRRTTEYYQAGATKDKNAPPLHLFVIVKDFLQMVDQACVDITRNLQQQQQQMKKKQAVAAAAASNASIRASSGGSPSNSGRMGAGGSVRRMAAAGTGESPSNSGRMSLPRFPNLPAHFLSDISRNSDSGSDSDGDF